MANTNSPEGNSTADCYSPVGHPHDFSLTDPFNPQPSVQHTVTPSGHSITPNNSFDNQQYNISFEAREAGADAGMFGEDMIEYVINPTM